MKELSHKEKEYISGGRQCNCYCIKRNDTSIPPQSTGVIEEALCDNLCRQTRGPEWGAAYCM